MSLIGLIELPAFTVPTDRNSAIIQREPESGSYKGCCGCLRVIEPRWTALVFVSWVALVEFVPATYLSF
jgi:hypothetical protein